MTRDCESWERAMLHLHESGLKQTTILFWIRKSELLFASNAFLGNDALHPRTAGSALSIAEIAAGVASQASYLNKLRDQRSELNFKRCLQYSNV
jgi:hypothetical protein